MSLASLHAFCVFTQDLSDNLSIPHIKYADDVSIWSVSDNPSVIEDSLCHNVEELLNWSYKWRQKISLSKTDALCFSKNADIRLNINARNIVINQVKEKRLLEVILDSRLSFKPHIENTAAEALGQLLRLNALTHGLRRATPTFLTMLYKCCIRPHLEFGYPVWCPADVDSLHKVQYQALKRCTGAMQGTHAAALEVLTGVIPLDHSFMIR